MFAKKVVRRQALLQAGAVWLPSAEEAEGVEADEDGAAFVHDDG